MVRQGLFVNDGAFQKLGRLADQKTSLLKLIHMYKEKEHVIYHMGDGRLRGHGTPGDWEWESTGDNDIKTQLLPRAFSSDRISANGSPEQKDVRLRPAKL